MNTQKIIPSLWFKTGDGKLAPVVGYYKTIFGDALEEGSITPLGETPSGYAEMTELKLFGQSYTFMSTAVEHHLFNDAFSLTLLCEDQAEIDRYWNYFTADGEESYCGWCNDKYGLRWQVVPRNLGELMQRPGAGEVMMRQRKIVIAEYPE